jgi:hypothetical protein
MKNALISGIVGLLFMAGGFTIGIQLMPRPKPAPVVIAPPATMTPPGAAVPVPTPNAISLETLKKTSESMMALNLALSDREKRVAEREAAAQAKEDEMAAERAALDASHEKFKALFNDFQSRLQLVEANQMQELQKQAELFGAMGPEQSVEMIRTMDDSTVTRLFSVMDTKPLAKLVSAWKTKYPDDAARLLRALNNTAQVMDKDKIALNDPLNGNAGGQGLSAPTPAAAPDAPPPAPDAPPPAPEPAAPGTPAPDAATPATAPDATPANSNSAPPDSGAPGSAPAPLAPPADPTAPASPAPIATPAATDAATPTEPDVTTPGATAEALGPSTAATIPVAQPASPSDLGVDATDLQPRRAKPVNITRANNN